MAHTSWPGIRNIIDSGHPCPIGIIIGELPDVTGLGHQVCAYAYQLDGQKLTLWVYDPNSPNGDNVTMRLDISRTDQPIQVVTNVNTPHVPICFFTQTYEQRSPVRARDIHVIEWRLQPPGQFWIQADLADFLADKPAIAAAGDPFAHITPDTIPRVLYRGANDHIIELRLQPGQGWIQADLADFLADKPAIAAAGDPFAHITPDTIPRVLYRGPEA